MQIGKPEHFLWLKGIVGSVFILNVLDGILTLWWYFSGRATEANPAMSNLIKTHPLLFIIVKMTLVALGSYLLWRLRHRALAVIAIFIAFMVYYTVLVYHLQHMNLYIIIEWLD